MDPASFLLLTDHQAGAPNRLRRGIPQLLGRAIIDDDGLHNYLGITYFYAPYAYEFERDRFERSADWLAEKRFDYARVLAEVDWPGRSIDPRRPSYEAVLAGTIDGLAKRGIRTQLSLVGGVKPDLDVLLDKVIRVCQPRADKLLYLEGANEAHRLDKVTEVQLVKINERLLSALPNLTALSCPPSGEGQLARWIRLQKECKARVLALHTERNEADAHCRQVRQAYDFVHVGENSTGSDQEGPGSDSSVGQLESPRWQALKRALAHLAGAGAYTYHCGAGVSGVPVPAYGRPAEFWETENVDAIISALHVVGALLPNGCQNWRLVNNGRDKEHPLQLDDRVSRPSKPVEGAGFWEGAADAHGIANKNYAALGPHDLFYETLIGVNAHVNGGLVPVGQALRRMYVEAIDPVDGRLVDERDLAAGVRWLLPGRPDKQMGYLIRGRYL